MLELNDEEGVTKMNACKEHYIDEQGYKWLIIKPTFEEILEGNQADMELN